MTGPFDRNAIADLVGDTQGEKLSFEKAIALFESVYMASRNLTERTRVEYKNDLVQLADFLATLGITKLDQASLAHLQAFLADLDAKGLTGVTRRRKTARCLKKLVQ
jgi:site-specific recombinase XerD